MNATTMRRLMVSATLATGLAVGFATAAQAQPNNNPWSDYADCVSEHPDKVGQETCCILYGGTWDPSQYLYECSLDRGEQPKPLRSVPDDAAALPDLTVNPGPVTPPKGPRVTPGRLTEIAR
ncbi:hypothetical protein [Mycobacterium sp. 3519A]|jgi:hypothetical protein|uniref:hypothetical protein n=1 Tax=Mycobacterium sp. 3519A TaxID=2057184 RepID=UPI0011593199|nr:hypothetical protein [Mycobacterium sp. 3519A]